MDAIEAVNYYHALGVFGVRPGLERIRALCRALGDPQKKLRVVHVAGTNGKGSTCTEIASVLRCAGYHTGLYTSPYVLDFRERIQINGEMIPSGSLADITLRVENAISVLNGRGVYPTEFEAITAAAFLYFAEENCDIVVLETGLGGRYDATNLIESPEVCVITSISPDHTKVLGETLPLIAAEKSGIIKAGVEVITTEEQPPEVLAVLSQDARRMNAPIRIVQRTEIFSLCSEGIDGSDIIYRGITLHIPFAGSHQQQNASLALAALETLTEKGYHISADALQQGFQSAFIPARTEILSRRPLVLLDGAHNPGGAEMLGKLLHVFLNGKKILAVMGMMADKDIEAVLRALLPSFSDVITVAPSNPRAIPAEQLKHIIEKRGGRAYAAENVHRAVQEAMQRLTGYDALIVCGSLYLAADIRPILRNEIKKIR